MFLLLIGILLWTAATALGLAVVAIVRRLVGRRPRWRLVLAWTLLSVPTHAIFTVPATLGWLGTRMVHTRRDEAAYRGPILAADGTWIEQTRESLRAGPPPVTPPAQELRLVAEDGVSLRAFFVPAAAPARDIDAVLVHGLFRGGLEIETVGRWLRAAGCDVLLLELRNHGGSGRAPAGFGMTEARDVRAAAAWFDARPGAGERRVLLFGVSLGSVAVALAAPNVPRLRWLVLDAPVVDPAATARRMLAAGPRRLEGRMGLPEPFVSLTLAWVELWAGVSLDAIRPLDALRRLAPGVRALVVGGARDDRVPPQDVEAAWTAIPAPEADKELWIEPEGEHGTVWVTAPQAYRERLMALLRE